MEKLPEAVKEKIAVLNEYREDPALAEFNLIHLYPGKLAYPDGYYEARWFRLIAFDTETRKKRDLGEHDGISLWGIWDGDRPLGNHVRLIRIFADGSTLIRFTERVKIAINTQDISLE